MYQKPSDPDETGAGYGYSNAEGLSENDVYFYHSDHIGSTSYITDKDGNVSQFIAYKPFGELLIDEHSVSYDSPWKFNGKEWDSETGLYYYGARYYEPGLSLWYGVDALAEKYPSEGGYVYCVGNPVKFVDVDGKEINMLRISLSDEAYGPTTISVLKDLHLLTGLQLSLDENYQLRYAKNEEGEPIISKTTNNKGETINCGSKSARRFLIKLIDDKTIINVSYGERSVTYCQTNEVALNYKQINGMIESAVGVDGNTIGFGMTFLHELHHTAAAGSLKDIIGNGTGDVVNSMNRIRRELNKQGFNFGQRLNYEAIKTEEGAFVPFNMSALFSLENQLPMKNDAKYIKIE